MRKKHLRQSHRGPPGLYLHRHGRHVPRRDALRPRARGHPFGHRRRRGRREAAGPHFDHLPLQPRARGQRHLRQRRSGRGQDPHHRGLELREPRERHPRGAPQTGGHAAGDGPPPGRGDGRPGHRHGGVPRRRAETVYDGRHRRARLPPLQGADAARACR